ncbi:MAG: hypothetical protein HFE73_05930 [Firmicutes bacterium]|nr:hypothetical protein [Bacillota bacterium]
MYTRRKRNYKARNYRTFVFSAVIVTLCLLIVAIAWPTETTPEPAYGNQPEDGKDDFNLTEKNQPVSGQTDSPDDNHDDGDDDGDANEEDDDKDGDDGEYFDGHDSEVSGQPNENNMTGENQSYYLIKRAGEQIVVYFCNEAGQLVQLETTEILYPLLGPEDQKLFDEGIKVNTQEELGVLLQDFEG